MATLPYSAAVTNPRPDARAVLLRAIAGARSQEELVHLRDLAGAHPGHAVTAKVERAIASRRRELDRARRALDRAQRALDRSSARPSDGARRIVLGRGTGDR